MSQHYKGATTGQNTNSFTRRFPNPQRVTRALGYSRIELDIHIYPPTTINSRNEAYIPEIRHSIKINSGLNNPTNPTSPMQKRNHNFNPHNARLNYGLNNPTAPVQNRPCNSNPPYTRIPSMGRPRQNRHQNRIIAVKVTRVKETGVYRA